MTEKTLKKMMHYLCSNANYDKPNPLDDEDRQELKRQGVPDIIWTDI